MTNFEKYKFRTLDQVAADIYRTDDLLADEICKNNEPCPYGDDVEINQCKECIKRWLESEVESK